MEAREGVLGSGGVRVVGTDAPANYHMAPRTENPVHIAGSDPAPAVPLQVGLSPATFLSVRKKRGRPRKYGPDGSVTMALSPKPISSSAPPSVIDFSAGKRGKFRPASETSRPRMEMENMGEWGACSVGASFTPHMITVNTGEDITMKVISFSQQGPRAICILSANGVISSVTLRQADSSGGTLTYEGRFEILSLTGSFMPTETGGTRNRSGGMSVSLASPDGRVVGGGVAGLLVAASPVQIVIGSFLTGNQHSQNAKKQKPENFPAAIPAAPMSSAETNEHYVQRAAAISNPNLSSSSFKWSSVPSDSRNNPTDINVSLQAG